MTPHLRPNLIRFLLDLHCGELVTQTVTGQGQQLRATVEKLKETEEKHGPGAESKMILASIVERFVELFSYLKYLRVIAWIYLDALKFLCDCNLVLAYFFDTS